MAERVVILGGGIAGLSACQKILEEAPETPVTLIHGEEDLPYLRPLLSKLALSTFRRGSLTIHPEDWYRKMGVRLILNTRVERILADKKEVLLADGQTIPYDKCIYALGARCYVPPVPGAHLPGVVWVRTIKDLQRIRRLLATTRWAVVIGGGPIGLEFAWALQQTGCEVTLLEALPQLMPQALDPQSAGVLAERCEAAGIRVCTGAYVAKIAGTETVEAVELTDGRCFPADLVLLSCGIRANVEVAKASGLACGRGLLVDHHLRTSAPGVYGAGDCIQLDESALHDAEGLCRTDRGNPGLWTYAAESGAIAGHNAISTPEEALPFVPEPAPLLVSALGTGIFALGEVREGTWDRTEVAEPQEDLPEGNRVSLPANPMSTEAATTPRFLVNPHEETSFRYEKRFYRKDRLVGAVLMGDLSRMAEYQEEIRRNHALNATPEVTE